MIGAGNTDAGCASGWGDHVRRFTTSIDLLMPDGSFVLQNADEGGSGSYLCEGDSGSAMLSSGNAVVATLSAGLNQNAYASPVTGPAVYDWMMANGLDVDGDEIQAALDNCEEVANDDQDDSDLNGIGDACQDTDDDGVLDVDDPCPEEAPSGAGDADGDVDGDGVCNSTDNCRQTDNPNQRNCNREIEEQEYLEELGDACDPAPCAEPHVISHVDASSYTDRYYCTDVPADFCPLEPGQLAWMRCATIESLELKIRALKPGCPDGPGTCTLVSSQDLPTSLRFCQDPDNTACADESFQQDEAHLTSSQCTTGCADPEAPGDDYLRVTLDGNPEGTKLIDYTTAFDNWSSYTSFEWDYIADYNRWTSSGLFPDPGSPYGLQGALWTHVAAPVTPDAIRRNASIATSRPRSPDATSATSSTSDCRRTSAAPVT